ncbi:MAG: hypothetical protein CL763_07630 [Chloroflexi bacterium]|nr:hypothetical protein [Chloroflexota bacterium]|tara:strand:- start:9965 stop:11458 length:1494 start_codon:yes stop_codon:yes gene_type:complete
MTKKILFWLGVDFTHFCLSHNLQKLSDADFYAIIDITNKPKSFFEEQKLVNFKKKWFFHDHISTNPEKPNLEYLSKIEKNYGINIWKLAINERIFYNFFNFHKFSHDEILSIDEQACRLFEKVLDEVKPDFFITKQPAFHHLELFYEMCRAKGVKVLMLNNSNFSDKSIIVEDISKLDDNSLHLDDFQPDGRTLDDFKSVTEILQKNLKTNVLKQNHTADLMKSAMKFFTAENENIKTNYNYFGRTKFNVLSFELNYRFNTKKRKKFIDKNLSSSPDLNENFIYFPLSLDMERSTLIDAPFYTNQVEVVRSIAKSIPVDHYLFVKEHPNQKLRGWREISEYEEISSIPNVILIHPDHPSEELYNNCSLVITIGGTAGFEAALHRKPSIIFTDLRYSILPSVFRLDSIENLSKTIQECIKTKVNPNDINKFIQLMENVTINFNWQQFVSQFQKTFYYDGTLFDVEISEKKLLTFLEKNKTVLDELASAHITKMSELSS